MKLAVADKPPAVRGLSSWYWLSSLGEGDKLPGVDGVSSKMASSTRLSTTWPMGVMRCLGSAAAINTPGVVGLMLALIGLPPVAASFTRPATRVLTGVPAGLAVVATGMSPAWSLMLELSKVLAFLD